MQTLGIIAEYNPFHNGHAYQIMAAKKASGATHTLVVMSGSAVQRGSFAVVDKWTRARQAVENGADLVLELPYAYACQSAEAFASGALSLLNDAGCRMLSFGMESPQIEPLVAVARILWEEPPDYQRCLKQGLAEGLSFPAARQQAIATLMCAQSARVLASPNNILAIEYLKAINRQGAAIQPIPIKRQSAGYHSQTLHGTFASASAIRKHLMEGQSEMIGACIPYDPAILSPKKWQTRVRGYQDYVLGRLLTMDLGELRKYPGVSEGLEFALHGAVKKWHTYEDILKAVSSKRIPQSRIRRILMHLSTEFTTTDFSELTQPVSSPYFRVLAFNRAGRQWIRRLAQESDTPVISNVRSNQTRLDIRGGRMLSFDLKATDLFYLFGGQPENIHQDFTQSPIYIES